MSSQTNTPAAAPAIPDALVEAILKRGQAVVATKRALGTDVVGVAEWGTSGPVRLTLRCKDGTAGCGKTHVRAVQDAHQARLCPDCRAKANKAAKKAKRSLKAGAVKAKVADLNARLQAAEAALAAAQAKAAPTK